MYYFKTTSVIWMLPLWLNASEYSGNVVIICLNIFLCQFGFDLKSSFWVSLAKVKLSWKYEGSILSPFDVSSKREEGES